MQPALQVKGVTVRFGGVVAVDNASLTIEKGQLIGFIGPNGAGKTTLMRVITGIVSAQEGTVHLDGRDLDGLAINQLIRAGKARALALDPKLLLLDEPLAWLNQSEASALADLIKALNSDGLTILLIEHNLREVMRICPQVYVQEQGRLLAFGNAKQVMGRSDVIKAYLGGS
ncbi:MAG: ATP-binding cassette domain-containing protein [Paracoccaceae bacterium]